MGFNAATLAARCAGLYSRLTTFHDRHPSAWQDIMSIAGDAADLIRVVGDSLRARRPSPETAGTFTARVSRRAVTTMARPAKGGA